MVKGCVFFLLNLIIHEHNVLEYTKNNYESKALVVRQILTGLTKGGGGVGEIFTMYDKGGRGGWGNADNGCRRGEGGAGPLNFWLT